jgi:hypothetical protein
MIEGQGGIMTDTGTKSIVSEFDAQIEVARRKRERNLIREALEELMLISARSEAMGLQDTNCKSLAEAIVCHQLMFDNDGDQMHLDEMIALAEHGINVAKSSPDAANRERVFHYRRGVAHFLRGHQIRFFKAASKSFAEALQDMQESDSQYPEFASYYGASLVLSDQEGGEDILRRAHGSFQRLMKKTAPAYEPWHAMIIECGIHMRYAMVFHHNLDVLACRVSMRQAKQLAEELASVHNMPFRLMQYTELAKKLGVL